MKFKLSIELGNDAMKTGNEVARALRAAADEVYRRGGFAAIKKEDRGAILDLNGNTVGTWEFVKE